MAKFKTIDLFFAYAQIQISGQPDPPALILQQAKGKEAGQTVVHFDIHVLPHHANDGIALSWPRKAPPSEVLQDHAQRLRQAMLSPTQLRR